MRSSFEIINGMAADGLTVQVPWTSDDMLTNLLTKALYQPHHKRLPIAQMHKQQTSTGCQQMIKILKTFFQHWLHLQNISNIGCIMVRGLILSSYVKE